MKLLVDTCVSPAVAADIADAGHDVVWVGSFPSDPGDEEILSLAQRIGNGYATARSQHIFRDFINAVAHVTITEKDIQVRFQKRAHNPLLMAAGFAQTDTPVPWLGRKRLQLVFG